MRFSLTIASLVGFAAQALGLGQNATLAFNTTIGGLQLAGGSKSPAIMLDSGDYPGVIRTATDLAADFGRVTGINGTVKLSNATMNATSGSIIIAGTIGNSSLIDSLVKSNKIDVSKIKGQWEAFSSQLVGDPMPGVSSALVIAGSDQRGSIYGLYDISEQIGVSPWYWFADVSPKKKSMVYAMNTTKIQPSPAVKYRGIFLNDEQPALNNWIQENYPNGKYGPGFGAAFYSHVFELLLRLRANYIWPAEWNSMFSLDDPDNDANAKYYGFVIGTSHTEPLMRWTKEQSLFLNGIWSWQYNQENVTEFLRQGAERAAPYGKDAHLFTMGMRGLGDTASPTLNASQLQDIIQVEQTLLKGAFNETDVSDIPQMWCLYKVWSHSNSEKRLTLSIGSWNLLCSRIECSRGYYPLVGRR